MHNTNEHNFGFYLLRLPALPFNNLEKLHSLSEKEEIESFLYNEYKDKSMGEKIYLASPDLYKQMTKWINTYSKNKDFTNEKLVMSLYKYYIRMCSRCTPFGLFAGYSTGEITTDCTDLRFTGENKDIIKNIRLDMEYIAEISNYLATNKDIRRNLIFHLNSSLYKKAGYYRYYEYLVKNKQRHYSLISVGENKYLDKVVNLLYRNRASYVDLLNLLLQDGITEEKAKNFLDTLIDSQIILSEFEPRLSGQDFLTYMVDNVQKKIPYHEKTTSLKELNEALLSSAYSGIEKYKIIDHILSKNFPISNNKDLIQVDLKFDAISNRINEEIINKIYQDIQSLIPLQKDNSNLRIINFIKNFSSRYEKQELPLLEVLDGETGIGYGLAGETKFAYAPLIEDILQPQQSNNQDIVWTPYLKMMFNKYNESQSIGGKIIYITDSDLQNLANAQKQYFIPETFYTIGKLIASGASSLNEGKFKFYLQACSGPGAMQLLARFGNSDPELATKLVDCGREEQDMHADTILAEIIHLPEARTGNILQRPLLRNYEIVFLGNSSVKLENQIPVQDLLISVVDEKIVIRSASLNKIITPRLTSAHNFHHHSNLSIYKFLCDLHYQNSPLNISWNWGLLEERPYLPRVEYKCIILSRARWFISKDAYDDFIELLDNHQVVLFLKRNNIPGRVVLAEGDNELFLDFKFPLAAQILAKHLKTKNAVLYEWLQDETHELVIDQHNNKYIHEIVIPFKGLGFSMSKQTLQHKLKDNLIQRSFPLGSEWTYVKIYCGERWGDKILTDYLLELISNLTGSLVIDKWFFIRYSDPNSHLRFRFHHDSKSDKTQNIIKAIHESLSGLLREQIIHNIEYSTYHREIERYGAETMDFSENIFYIDSNCVMRFLNLIEGDQGERYRWLFALRGVDTLLSDFGLSLDDKTSLIQNLANNFFLEFKGSKELLQKLDTKFRREKINIFSFMNSSYENSDSKSAIELLTIRSASIKELIDIHDTKNSMSKAISHPLYHLIPSYIHMFLNRLFVSSHRKHELVIYHFLTKYYKYLSSQLNINN